jgi:hypothetical protein
VQVSICVNTDSIRSYSCRGQAMVCACGLPAACVCTQTEAACCVCKCVNSWSSSHSAKPKGIQPNPVHICVCADISVLLLACRPLLL